MPLLTIAIPTFNRANILFYSISNILEQIRGYDIELLISDNRSTDNTQEIVREFMSINKQVRLTINRSEQSADYNILNSLKESKGDYIWLMGDDDFLMVGSIPSIMKCIDKNVVLIHVNTCGVLSKGKKLYSPKRYKDQGIIYYSDINEFIKKIGIYITFLSGLIIKRSCFNHLDQNLVESFIGTHFLQSHIAFNILMSGNSAIDTNACVASSPNNRASYDPIHVWIIDFYNLFYTTAKNCGISENIIDNVVHNALKYEILDFVCKYLYTSYNTIKRDSIKESQMILQKFPDILKDFNLLLKTRYHFLPVFRLFFRTRRDFHNFICKYYMI